MYYRNYLNQKPYMRPSLIKKAAMSTISKSNNRCHVRCISFPPRSHPITQRIQQHLTKLTKNREQSLSSSVSKAETIYNSLSDLAELYKWIEELLSFPMTQQALAGQQQAKWVSEILEGSLKFIDICSKARDTVMVLKESIRDLQSAVRRSKVEDVSIQSNISTYVSIRKRMKKELAEFLVVLKRIDCKSDENVSAIIRVFTEASVITIFVFQLLVAFLSVPVVKPKPSRWSMVSKLVTRGAVAVAGEGQRSHNELEKMDIAITNFSIQHEDAVEEERIESAQRRLEMLDGSI